MYLGFVVIDIEKEASPFRNLVCKKTFSSIKYNITRKVRICLEYARIKSIMSS